MTGELTKSPINLGQFFLFDVGDVLVLLKICVGSIIYNFSGMFLFCTLVNWFVI